METKTFRQLFEERLQLPQLTPKQAFVKEVAKITMKSEATVYCWTSGHFFPDKLTQKTIGEHFGVDPAGLFPGQRKVTRARRPSQAEKERAAAKAAQATQEAQKAQEAQNN